LITHLECDYEKGEADHEEDGEEDVHCVGGGAEYLDNKSITILEGKTTYRLDRKSSKEHRGRIHKHKARFFL
jgi:hypothetical protein